MKKDSPQSVFESAQHAMKNGDWHSFFSCLDRKDNQRILNNTFKLIMMRNGCDNDNFINICQKSEVPVKELCDLWQKQAWKEYETRLTAIIKSVRDTSDLTAELEIFARSSFGGGSVSTRLFIGESLTDLVVEGKQAYGMREINSSYSEPVGFVLSKYGWHIKLFVKCRKTD